MSTIARHCLAMLLLAILLPHKSLADNTAEKSILVLGDSISAAYGMHPSEGWVSLLEQRLQSQGYSHYQVINASISGNTSGDGISRLPLLLENYRPDIIIVELGGNDGLRGYPLKVMRNNLQAIIHLSQQAGAKVLLAGIEIPPNYGQRYTDAFRASYVSLAENNKLTFLPFILKGIATNPALMQADQIHPTRQAQVIILDNVWPYLQTLL
ncbi:MAG: arylesterase [Pseudomonadota bacterium]